MKGVFKSSQFLLFFDRASGPARESLIILGRVMIFWFSNRHVDMLER